MTDIMIVVVVAAAVFLAIRYIVKEKKKGVKCIGCPMAGTCSGAGKKTGTDGCCSSDEF